MGAEESLRRAEKRYSEAHVNLSKAEEALYDNQDPSLVADLITAVRDAQTAVNTKEINLAKAQELVDLLNEDYNNIWKKRDEALAAILAAEVADAKARLAELETAFQGAEETKKAYDTEETRLMEAKTLADAGDD